MTDTRATNGYPNEDCNEILRALTDQQLRARVPELISEHSIAEVVREAGRRGIGPLEIPRLSVLTDQQFQAQMPELIDEYSIGEVFREAGKRGIRRLTTPRRRSIGVKKAKKTKKKAVNVKKKPVQVCGTCQSCPGFGVAGACCIYHLEDCFASVGAGACSGDCSQCDDCMCGSCGSHKTGKGKKCC